MENDCSSLENSDGDDWLGPSDSEGANILVQSQLLLLLVPAECRKQRFVLNCQTFQQKNKFLS